VLYTGVAQGEACTMVLRGATQQILDEAERSIHDALCVLSQTVKEPRICYGGGLFSFSYSFSFKKKVELVNRCCGNVNGYCCFSIS